MSAIASIDLSGLTSQSAGQAFGSPYGAQYGTLHVLGATTASNTPVAKEPPARAPEPDQVQLSRQAEARLLRSQGESLTEIEAKLGVGETTVASYLGITNGTQTLVAAATAAVESKAAQSFGS